MIKKCLHCERKSKARNLCKRCYMRRWRNIKFGRPENFIPELRANKNSGCKRTDGYKILMIKNHPNAMKGGRILEHTFIMSQHLGRALKKEERIHHKNGIRDDNRIENLELWTRSHPDGCRVEDKVKWAKEFLESYGYKIN